jgi:undecaprenyl-diphosphatase
MDARRIIRDTDFREMLRRSETRIGIVLLMIVCGIWVFIEIADEVNEEDASGFDEAIMLAMREGPSYVEMAGPEWVEKFASDLTVLGGFPFVLLLSLIVLGYLLLSRHFMHAAEVALAVGGGAALVMGLKDVFERVRPEVVPPMYEVTNFSFPSGHASTSAVIYLALGILLARFITRHILKIYVFGVAFLLTFIVGWTRIALGVHYPTDVLAGWALGLIWALFSWLVVHVWENYLVRSEQEHRGAEMVEDTEAEATQMSRDSVDSPIPSQTQESS